MMQILTLYASSPQSRCRILIVFPPPNDDYLRHVSDCGCFCGSVDVPGRLTLMHLPTNLFQSESIACLSPMDGIACLFQSCATPTAARPNEIKFTPCPIDDPTD